MVLFGLLKWPDPLPDTIWNGEAMYLYLDGIGNDIANAALYTMNGDIDEPWECANDIDFFEGTLLVMGEYCAFESGILPIALTFFDAKQVRNMIQISWETSFEFASREFIVQRSRDMYHWDNIATVAGRGNYDDISIYRVFDEVPKVGANYYRLKFVDYNGVFEYSEVLDVTFNPVANCVPNPTSDILTIWGKFYMYNSQGQLVASGIDEQLNVQNFEPGLYFVRVGTETHKVVVQ